MLFRSRDARAAGERGLGDVRLGHDEACGGAHGRPREREGATNRTNAPVEPQFAGDDESLEARRVDSFGLGQPRCTRSSRTDVPKDATALLTYRSFKSTLGSRDSRTGLCRVGSPFEVPPTRSAHGALGTLWTRPAPLGTKIEHRLIPTS